MKSTFKYLYIFIAFLLMAFAATGCVSPSENEPPGEENGGDSADSSEGDGRLLLIYAVAANNLDTYLTYDMREICKAGKDLNLNDNCVLVYSVDRSNEPKLQRLVKRSGDYVFETVHVFNEKLPLSTSPERMREVIEYVCSQYQYSTYGLVLWSHATGWRPFFGGSTPPQVRKYSFGQDYYEGQQYQMQITQLPEGIPGGIFDFIWFDCCYMGNIETIFQLREKAEKIVGYVMEIASEGMPYDLTMPYLLRNNANLIGAAEQLFDYYEYRNTAVTVSIVDTEGLDALARASSEFFLNGTPPTSFANIKNYSRLAGYPFYDMGQLLEAYQGITAEEVAKLKEAFSGCLEYKAITDFDFNNRYIDPEKFSGLSMHHFIDNGSADENFYKTLDWFNATRY